MKAYARRELAENLVLGFLVILSIGLSIRIWLGTAQPRISYSESAVYHAISNVGERHYLSEMLMPNRIIVHLGNDRHTLFLPGFSGYERMWSVATKSLGEIDPVRLASPSLRPAQMGAIGALRKLTGVELVLSPTVPFGVWLEAMSIVPASASPDRGNPTMELGMGQLRVDRIAVFWDGDLKGFVRQANTGEYFELAFKSSTRKPEEIVELSSSVIPGYVELTEADGVPVRDGIFVPKRAPYIAAVEVKPQMVEPDRIAAEFFPDLTVIRRVEERDGCTVFTDGRGWLRVFGDGSLEFTHSERLETSVADMGVLKALSSAVEFIRFHGGWPDGAYLSSVVAHGTGGETPRGGAAFRFGFNSKYRGIPVLGDREAIQMVVSANGVSAYRRCVREYGKSVEEPKQVLGANDILVSLKGFLQRSGMRPLPTVIDVYLAYGGVKTRGPDEDGIDFIYPVWAVAFSDGRLCLIDAYKGDVVSWNGSKPS